MMLRKQTATILGGAIILILASVVGCATSNPNVEQARAALKQSDYSTALSDLEKALDQDSSNTEAYLLKAKILRQRADSGMTPERYKELHSRARGAEEEALSFDSDLRDEVQARRKQVFDREVERGKLAYNQANKNERKERYRRAVSYFGAAGIAQADSARPVLNEAFARFRIGQREEVIPVLESYVERADTPSTKAYKMLGQLYLEQQNQKVIALLDQATRFYPDDQELQGLRLNAYNRAGSMDQALDAYREQVKNNPENATYRYNYGALLLEAERYADAIAQLDSAVALRPAHVESQYNLGAAYVNAALARDDSIATLEKRAEKSTADAGDATSVEEKVEMLAQKREDLFEKAVPPLERVRKMSEAGRAIRTDACRALMVAYVQTGRPNRAAQVESCTGFTKPNSGY